VSDAHADTGSEIGRALAAVRWSPEGRLRAAVDTVAELAAVLDDAQRARLEAAIGGDPGGDGPG
jgi:hypothetical protein